MNRRNVLKGLSLGAGAGLLTPLLNRMVREAHGASSMPLRFVFVDSSMGWDPERFEPPSTDLVQSGLNPAMQSLPLFPELADGDSWDPARILSPRGEGLNAYSDRILLLDEFYNHFNMGLHGNGSAHLTFEPTPLDDPDGVDSGSRHKSKSGRDLHDVIADHIGTETPYPVVTVDVQGNAEGPYEFYDRFFKQLDDSEQEAALAQLQQRQARLALVKGDVERAKTRLASFEREKMDVYLDSLDQLDSSLTRQARALSLACTSPPPPEQGLPLEHKKYAPIHVARFDSLLQSGLAALTCGLTNVLRVKPVPGRGNWHFLANEDDKHNTEHNLGNGSQDAVQHLVNIDQWIAGRISDIADRLAMIPEGDGTMLDNTLIVWLDDNGGTHHTSGYDKAIPNKSRGVDVHRALLLGNPTGYFKTTGIWKRYDRGTRSVGDLYTTLLNALGIEAEHFGDQDRVVEKAGEAQSVAEHSHGPLPGLS